MLGKIILIEDDEDILEIITFILEEEGYQVIASLNCLTVKEILNHKPLIVLMDNQLRDGNGYDLCKELKSLVETKNIPVIIISGDCELEANSKKCNANAFLKKPFNIITLTNLVKKTILENQ